MQASLLELGRDDVPRSSVGSGLWCSFGRSAVLAPRRSRSPSGAVGDHIFEHVGTARSEGELAVLMADAERRARRCQVVCVRGWSV